MAQEYVLTRACLMVAGDFKKGAINRLRNVASALSASKRKVHGQWLHVFT